MIKKTSTKRRDITEREMTPAQRLKVASLRQKMKARNLRQLQKVGLKTGGELEVTDNKPAGGMEIR